MNIVSKRLIGLFPQFDLIQLKPWAFFTSYLLPGFQSNFLCPVIGCMCTISPSPHKQRPLLSQHWDEHGVFESPSSHVCPNFQSKGGFFTYHNNILLSQVLCIHYETTSSFKAKVRSNPDKIGFYRPLLWRNKPSGINKLMKNFL